MKLHQLVDVACVHKSYTCLAVQLHASQNFGPNQLAPDQTKTQQGVQAKAMYQINTLLRPKEPARNVLDA